MQDFSATPVKNSFNDIHYSQEDMLREGEALDLQGAAGS